MLAGLQTGENGMPFTQPPHPGTVIRERIIDHMTIKQADLARLMGVTRAHVNQLVHGRANVTTNIAVRLARVSSTNAGYWLQLQMDYDLHRVLNVFPVDETPCFSQLLEAIDEADRELHREENRSCA
jgi:addiction module HigA family antidote